MQAVPDPDLPEHSVQTFTHELLLQQALQSDKLWRRDLPMYHEWLDSWADKHAALGWLQDTPRFLLAPYGRQLLQRNELRRLADLAASAPR